MGRIVEKQKQAEECSNYMQSDRQENTYKSAYNSKKRKEIREGKKKEGLESYHMKMNEIHKQEEYLENSTDYLLQLIRGLEDKIYNMECIGAIALNRS